MFSPFILPLPCARSQCLSKWYHVGAAKAGLASSYDDACEHVYGMSYKAWKQTHQAKASDEQLRRMEETKALHAKHETPPPVAPAPAPAAARNSGAVSERATTATGGWIADMPPGAAIANSGENSLFEYAPCATPLLAAHSPLVVLTLLLPPPPPCRSRNSRYAGAGSPTRMRHAIRRFAIFKQRVEYGEVTLRHVRDAMNASDYTYTQSTAGVNRRDASVKVFIVF